MPVSDQGNLRGRYTLIPRTLIFITCGERVLLIRGAPSKRLWANLYNGIGGHLERGEDIHSAAKRELLEETGLNGIDLRLVGTVTIDTGTNTGIGLYVYRGECVGAKDPGATGGTSATQVELPDDWRANMQGSMPGNMPNSLLPKLIHSDEGNLEWVEIDSTANLPLVEDLHILLPHLLAMKPNEPPFSAHYSYDSLGKMVVRFEN